MDGEWEKKLVNDTRKLRSLLRDVDQASEALWFDNNSQLTGARYRYIEIFLPMYAAHLEYSGAIKLDGAVKKRIARITQQSKRNLRESRLTAEKHALDWSVSEGEQLDKFMEPFSRLPIGSSLAKIEPIPPLDVAFLWVLHRLHPKQYEKDSIEMFGCPFPVGELSRSGLDYVCASNDTEITSLVSRLQWACFAGAIGRTRKKPMFGSDSNGLDRTFLPNYLWPRFAVGDGAEKKGELKSFPASAWEKSWAKRSVKATIDFNFTAAAELMRVFAYNVCSPYYDDEASLLKGVGRYRKYLELMKNHAKEPLVPLYDINLAWHAHILGSTNLDKEEWEIVEGRFVDNEEEPILTPKEKMDKYLDKTAELWKDAFGEEYADENTGYQGRLKHEPRFRVYNGDESHVIRSDRVKQREFVMANVSDECKTRKRFVDMRIQSRNNLFRAAGIRRFSQIEGGASAGMYCEGYVMGEAVAQLPGGVSGNPKKGATAHEGNTPLGLGGALLVFTTGGALGGF